MTTDRTAQQWWEGAMGVWFTPEPNTGCWLWLRATSHGYGRIVVGRKKMYAHAVAYAAFNGAIPEGMEIDHLCFTKTCCNPEHLQAVSGRENLQRSWRKWKPGICGTNARKTHCIRGHEFTPENTYRWRGENRMCRQCARERA